MNENLKSTSQDVLDSDPSPDKRERSVTIPVAKLWWAAAVVLLSLTVTLHPYVLLIGSGHAMKGAAWWIVVFSIVNVITVSFVLRHLFRWELSAFDKMLIRMGVKGFRLKNDKPYVLSCFIPVLGLSWGVSVGALLEWEKMVSSWFVASGLVVLGVIHIVYNGVKFYRSEPDEPDEPPYPLIFQGFVCVGIEGAFSWNSLDWWWTPVVVLLSYGFLFLALTLSDDEREKTSSMVSVWMGVLCFLLWGIPNAWYATIYTVAEFATYHDMPAVVDICLPESPNLSPTQRKHMGRRSGDYGYESGGEWAKNALKYAVQHGDAASAFAYLRSLDSHLLKEQIDELAKVVDMLPLSEALWERYPQNSATIKALSSHNWSGEAICKQVSFDEPTVLAWIMRTVDKSSWGFGAIPAEIAKQNAKKCAVYLIRKDGGRASYRTSTLLQAAVQCKNAEMVELLLKYGADPDFAECGETPRQMAEKMKWPYAIKLCRELQYEAQ